MTGAQGVELGNMINNGAMQWYSLVTGKQQQTSAMRNMFGSDFGGGTLTTQAAAPFTVVAVIGLLLLGVILVAKR